jgi:hypothetical protein
MLEPEILVPHHLLKVQPGIKPPESFEKLNEPIDDAFTPNTKVSFKVLINPLVSVNALLIVPVLVLLRNEFLLAKITPVVLVLLMIRLAKLAVEEVGMFLKDPVPLIVWILEEAPAVVFKKVPRYIVPIVTRFPLFVRLLAMYIGKLILASPALITRRGSCVA